MTAPASASAPAPALRRPLRVGLDARAFSSPAAGVRRYVEELSRALQVYVDAGELELIPVASERLSLPTNFGRHASALPLGIRRARLDVFHAPAYTAPQWGSTPTVLSVHDVSYARHPEWYPYRRDPLRRWFYRRSARAATLIVTISEFSQREIVAAYGIPPDRIIVTPLGVSERFRPRESEATAGPPFLLHVGDLHARRNLAIVVRALAWLRARAGQLGRIEHWPPEPTVAGAAPSGQARERRPSKPQVAAAQPAKLVLAGVDRGLAGPLLAEATALGVADAIELRGRVTEEELVRLYQGCAALVYPSRYEGFGFPLVEAMACGAPVIASNASAIPEVTGSAALLIDPDDEPGFAAAIERVLSDAAWAADLRAKGLARAAQFTWAATAARTLAAYRRAAGHDAP
jgi:glycosyltransferase involved in cell wall biosynthesis